MNRLIQRACTSTLRIIIRRLKGTRLDVFRQWDVLRRSELTAVMNNITTHKNELRWLCGGPGQSRDVPGGMPGGVEEVQAPILVEVDRLVLPKVESVFGEVELNELPIFPSVFVHGTVLICRPAWDEGLLEARTHDKCCLFRELRGVSGMILLTISTSHTLRIYLALTT